MNDIFFVSLHFGWELSTIDAQNKLSEGKKWGYIEWEVKKQEKIFLCKLRRFLIEFPRCSKGKNIRVVKNKWCVYFFRLQCMQKLNFVWTYGIQRQMPMNIVSCKTRSDLRYPQTLRFWRKNIFLENRKITCKSKGCFVRTQEKHITYIRMNTVNV